LAAILNKLEKNEESNTALLNGITLPKLKVLERLHKTLIHHWEQIKTIVGWKGEVTEDLTSYIWTEHNYMNLRTALPIAAENGHRGIVEQLLTRSADANKADIMSCTLLYLAVE